MPSADSVLIAAVGLVLTGAGLPEAADQRNGRGTGTGFVVTPVVDTPTVRATVTWYQDGKPAGGTETSAGKLPDCEQALRRAGFQVEQSSETMSGCLRVWRI